MPKKKRGRRRKKTNRPQSRKTASLSKVSTNALEAELQRRQETVEDLLAQKEQLIAELDVVERELKKHRVASGGKRVASRGGDRASGGVRKRPRNKLNLVEALAKMMKSRTLSVTNAASVVQKAGYKTTSPNFRTIVNQTLLANPKVFKKVSRGNYTAR